MATAVSLDLYKINKYKNTFCNIFTFFNKSKFFIAYFAFNFAFYAQWLIFTLKI